MLPTNTEGEATEEEDGDSYLLDGVDSDDSRQLSKSGRDLPHDPWLVPEGTLLGLADSIFAEAEALTPAARSKQRRDATARRGVVMGNLVANLAVATLRDEPRRIAISTKNTALTRYDRPKFPRQVVPQTISSLETLGLLFHHKGSRGGLMTTIESTSVFRRRLAATGAGLGAVGRVAGGETIILKAGAERRLPKVPVNYEDTAETFRLREEMERINTFLNASGITIDGKEQPPFLLTRRFQIPSNRSPHTFDQHGRIYDGFWINMHRTERHRLRIGGEMVADLDFTGMFTQLAYLHAGLPLPEGDPYGGIEGLEPDPINDPEGRRRDAIKRGLNAFYFRHGRMVRLPKEVKELLGPEWNATLFAAAVRKRHAPIKHLFGTGVGIRLMHTESRVLIRALLDLADINIPALPVHDGIMVPLSRQEIAMAIMRSASRAILGVELQVKLKAFPSPS